MHGPEPQDDHNETKAAAAATNVHKKATDTNRSRVLVSCLLAGASVYANTDDAIAMQPDMLTGLSFESYSAQDISARSTVVTALARDFITESEYLYTAGMAIPLSAFKNTTHADAGLRPEKKPGASSFVHAVKKCPPRLKTTPPEYRMMFWACIDIGKDFSWLSFQTLLKEDTMTLMSSTPHVPMEIIDDAVHTLYCVATSPHAICTTDVHWLVDRDERSTAHRRKATTKVDRDLKMINCAGSALRSALNVHWLSKQYRAAKATIFAPWRSCSERSSAGGALLGVIDVYSGRFERK